ncbi:MAG: methionine adenosyltransferase [Bacilli bacterium]
MDRYYFTSESVTEGHPDKICDRIADTILDFSLKEDKESKMAVEATIKDDLIFIYGEASTSAKIDYAEVAKNVLKEIGYKENYNVIVKVTEQSPEINNAVNKNGTNIGAGDQGIMFGYACDETEDYMPASIYYAHKLAKKLSEAQKKYDILGPDGKTQVTVEYCNDKINKIDTIIISTQHVKDIEKKVLEELIYEEVIHPIVPVDLIKNDTKILINPSGSFVLGGSFGDSGTTGRKIVCDSYGGYGRVGGGCFSSKDPSKVDRSGAYYCRYVAKNIVANGLANKCEIQIAYAIGKSKPISIFIDTFGTSKFSNEKIRKIITDNFDFEVYKMIDELDLKKPVYASTSCYGHFGRKEFTWEKIKKLKF